MQLPPPRSTPAQHTYRRHTLWIALISIVLLSGPMIGIAAGQDAGGAWIQTAHLTDPSTPPDAELGSAVAIDGNIAIVGAPGDRTLHIYERTATLWQQTRTLEGPRTFGSTVAIDGTTLAVGAPGPGKVFVFRESGGSWNQAGVLTVPDANCLGDGLALEDDLLVAGDPCRTDAAYVFHRGPDGWTLEATLTTPDDPFLGHELSLDAGSILVAGTETAYLFHPTENGWTAPTRLAASVSVSNFGSALALEGDIAAVGAWGTVFVFDLSGETPTERVLRPTDASPALHPDRFGTELALEQGTLAVGAPRDDPTPGNPSIPSTTPETCISQFGFGTCLPPTPGAVYLFEENGTAWVQTKKPAPNAVGEDRFGAAVALSADGETLLVGAPGSLKSSVGGVLDVDPLDAAHIFERVVG